MINIILEVMNMVMFKEISEENYSEVINLEINDFQKAFVGGIADAIEESKKHEGFFPLVIYDDEIIIGFLMYNNYPESITNDKYWIRVIIIDRKYQKKGYGKIAMEKIIDEIKKDKKHNKINLCVERDNKIALNLYKKLGFIFDGRIFGNQPVMELKY
jgi:diamine N-acetyltransferase